MVERLARLVRGTAVAALVVAAVSTVGAQGVGALLSPGELSQAHASLEGIANCQKCHEPGQGVSAQKCLACHQPIAERIAARKGVHRDVTDDCVSCHVEHAGRDGELRPLDPASFDHLEETGFALDGRHADVKCAKCHITRSFLTAKPDCASCHQDAHKGTLGGACASCHAATVPFKDAAQAFDHSKAAFALTGKHRTVPCASCHPDKRYAGIAFEQCSSCHKDPHRGGFGAQCSSCHTADGWKQARFDHSTTHFPLVGRHTTVACIACHGSAQAAAERPKFARCADCHQDPHKGVFPEDCASCHTEAGFGGAHFDHATRTKFPLTERHAEVACVACHRPAAATVEAQGRKVVDFRGLDTRCASCHQDAHRGALGTDCASCHQTRSFRVTEFTHPRAPEFFAGAHAGVACASCHKDGSAPVEDGAGPVSGRTYRGLSMQCASCHKDVHMGQLGADCARCHSVEARGFKAVGFDHSKTAFQLDGAHQALACAKCHVPQAGRFPDGQGAAVRYAGLGRECASCHRDPHLGQVGADCARCHSTATFAVKSFTHPESERFFTGKHANVACVACHPRVLDDFPAGRGEAVRLGGLDRQCSTCHADVHRGALGADCASCHTVTAPFADPSRAFHKSTGFPLQGRHLAVPCADCHWNGVTKGTPTRCVDCHWIRRQDDRFATRLGTDCETCHRPTSWSAVTWQHGAATGFQLVGAHATIDCESCHVGGRFEAGLPSQCVDCHLSDYQKTTDPNHQASGFPTTCETCHRASDSSWNQATFDHGTYPLVGVHATQPCQSCHASGVYAGLPSDCVDCHRTDYERTTEPNHQTAGFPTTCETCHKASDSSWNQATFDHGTYPLVGVHATQPCQSCHASGVYAGLPSECVDCHRTEYERTTDPNHQTAGFPTTCETCHKASDSSWNQATFDHGTYPLVGVHATQPCQACHASGVYAGLPSECVDCHLAAYQGTTDPNHETAGFPTTCETCHKASDSNWNQATFDHGTYPLVGVHATQPCQSCHASGVYAGLPSECVDCHLAAYQGTTEPNHQTAGFPTTCETCHKASDSSWNQATFDHGTYPLVGVHATQPCQSCHASGVYAGLPSECVDCHLDGLRADDRPEPPDGGLPDHLRDLPQGE